MSSDITFRRRAIYTGLKPFLDEPRLMEALDYWERHYAQAPRFTLQRFVAELCREGELRSRRADILLSLVQAMSMPRESLLPDPMPQQRSEAAAASETRAFEAVLDALFEITASDRRYSLRLDLLASLDTRRMPAPLCHALQRWLADKSPLHLPPTEPATLRLLLNRAYVILCERAGPVDADRILARAVDRVTDQAPGYATAVARLL